MKANGSILGPFDYDKLLSLWKREKILPATIIWISGQEQDGMPVTSFSGLLEKLQGALTKDVKYMKSVAFAAENGNVALLDPTINSIQSAGTSSRTTIDMLEVPSNLHNNDISFVHSKQRGEVKNSIKSLNASEGNVVAVEDEDSTSIYGKEVEKALNEKKVAQQLALSLKKLLMSEISGKHLPQSKSEIELMKTLRKELEDSSTKERNIATEDSPTTSKPGNKEGSSLKNLQRRRSSVMPSLRKKSVVLKSPLKVDIERLEKEAHVIEAKVSSMPSTPIHRSGALKSNDSANSVKVKDKNSLTDELVFLSAIQREMRNLSTISQRREKLLQAVARLRSDSHSLKSKVQASPAHRVGSFGVSNIGELTDEEAMKAMEVRIFSLGELLEIACELLASEQTFSKTSSTQSQVHGISARVEDFKRQNVLLSEENTMIQNEMTRLRANLAEMNSPSINLVESASVDFPKEIVEDFPDIVDTSSQTIANASESSPSNGRTPTSSIREVRNIPDVSNHRSNAEENAELPHVQRVPAIPFEMLLSDSKKKKRSQSSPNITSAVMTPKKVLEPKTMPGTTHDRNTTAADFQNVQKGIERKTRFSIHNGNGSSHPLTFYPYRPIGRAHK